MGEGVGDGAGVGDDVGADIGEEDPVLESPVSPIGTPPPAPPDDEYLGTLLCVDGER